MVKASSYREFGEKLATIAKRRVKATDSEHRRTSSFFLRQILRTLVGTTFVIGSTDGLFRCYFARIRLLLRLSTDFILQIYEFQLRDHAPESEC
jgi:hypothetical protein